MKTTIKPEPVKSILFTAAIICGSTLSDQAAAQTAPTSVASLRNTPPYNTVGRITILHGDHFRLSSGTVIKPQSVLTAGHNLYRQETGWGTSVVFQRSYHDGNYASTASASKLFILAGYSTAVNKGSATSNSSFSLDTGGIVCFSRPMNGDHALFRQNKKLLRGSIYNMSLGYGGKVNNGQQLLRSAPTRGYYVLWKRYYRNATYGLEGGMSGGPVFARSKDKWYVCAVNVSKPRGVLHSGAGIRLIGADTSKLIKNNLR